MEKEIGKITHHYGKVSVGIIELTGTLAVGDKIKVKRGEQEFEQKVESLELEHQAVESAKAGDSVGVKLQKSTKEGAVVYKVE